MSAAATETTIESTLPTAAQAKAVLTKANRAKAAAEAKAASDAKAAEQALKNKLRNEAQQEVLNNHRDEFVAVAEAKFAEHGLVFTRRMTESEKAAKKIADLLAAHPELASQFPGVAPSEADEAPEEILAYTGPDTVNYSEGVIPVASGESVPSYDMEYVPAEHGEEPVFEQ